MGLDAEKNAWIQTNSGKKFDILSPTMESIDIKDITHALSMTCRYAGHTNSFYSVAEHSVLVSRKVEKLTDSPIVALTALLHDASEAYLHDVTSPLKALLPRYVEIEREVQSLIYAKFIFQNLGFFISTENQKIIHDIDQRIRVDETYALFNTVIDDWPEGEPVGIQIERWNPMVAMNIFGDRFNRLMRTIKEKNSKGEIWV